MPFPSTEHEWNVHVINIHGTFFERWCQDAISTVEGWRVRSTNYPVQSPRSSAAATRKRKRARHLGSKGHFGLEIVASYRMQKE